jgi:hypothetical protein
MRTPARTESATTMRARVGLASYLVGDGRGLALGDAGGTSLGSSCCARANIWFASATLPVSLKSRPRLKYAAPLLGSAAMSRR